MGSKQQEDVLYVAKVQRSVGGGWALRDSRKGNRFSEKGDPLAGWAVVPLSTYLSLRVTLGMD